MEFSIVWYMQIYGDLNVHVHLISRKKNSEIKWTAKFNGNTVYYTCALFFYQHMNQNGQLILVHYSIFYRSSKLCAENRFHPQYTSYSILTLENIRVHTNFGELNCSRLFFSSSILFKVYHCILFYGKTNAFAY